MRARSVPFTADFALVREGVEPAPLPHAPGCFQCLPVRGSIPATRCSSRAQQPRGESNDDGAVADRDLDSGVAHDQILERIRVKSNRQDCPVRRQSCAVRSLVPSFLPIVHSPSSIYPVLRIQHQVTRFIIMNPASATWYGPIPTPARGDKRVASAIMTP